MESTEPTFDFDRVLDDIRTAGFTVVEGAENTKKLIEKVYDASSRKIGR